MEDTAKRSLKDVLVRAHQDLLDRGQTPRIQELVADVEHLLAQMKSWEDGSGSFQEREAAMREMMGLLEEVYYEDDVTAVLVREPVPQRGTDLSLAPPPMTLQEQKSIEAALSAEPAKASEPAPPVVRLNFSRAEAGKVARAVLQGQDVRCALEAAPEQLAGVELCYPDAEPLQLLVESVGPATDGGELLLRLKPLGDFQSGQLLALAAEADTPGAQAAPRPSTLASSPDIAVTSVAVSIDEVSSAPTEVSAADSAMRMGRYDVVRKLGSGGMATVYLAKLGGIGGFERQVAIKVMHEAYASDPKFRAMFLDEARLAAGIHHHNVVSTLDVQESDEGMFLVMEYIAGPSLRQLSRKLAKVDALVPLGVAMRIAVEALMGLHAAHELQGPAGEVLNLVHRDVSPHNILIGNDGITRITDFGIAFAERRLAESTGAGFKGKITYFAPEQGAGLPLDRRADVYAMGIVLWEMLTGRRLFRGESQLMTARQIMGGVKVPPSQVAPRVPQALDEVCMRALQREPSKRFPTALHFAEMLERAADLGGVTVASPREVAQFVDNARHDRVSPRAVEPPAAIAAQSSETEVTRLAAGDSGDETAPDGLDDEPSHTETLASAEDVLAADATRGRPVSGGSPASFALYFLAAFVVGAAVVWLLVR